MTNWLPISEFKPEDLNTDEEFLVWVELPGETATFFAAQWHPDLSLPEGAEEPEYAGEPRFQGEWRHVEAWLNCEPIAFARIDPCTLFDGEKQEFRNVAA